MTAAAIRQTREIGIDEGCFVDLHGRTGLPLARRWHYYQVCEQAQWVITSWKLFLFEPQSQSFCERIPLLTGHSRTIDDLVDYNLSRFWPQVVEEAILDADDGIAWALREVEAQLDPVIAPCLWVFFGIEKAPDFLN